MQFVCAICTKPLDTSKQFSYNEITQSLYAFIVYRFACPVKGRGLHLFWNFQEMPGNESFVCVFRDSKQGVRKMSVPCRKAYVSVNLDVDQEGVFYPRFIRWENGLIFQIDQILY